MVRKLNFNKENTKETQLKELEEEEKMFYNDVDNIKRERDRELELDTAFYFSVIFNDREERDAFLNKYKIELYDNFSVMSKDFIKAIEKKELN